MIKEVKKALQARYLRYLKANEIQVTELPDFEKLDLSSIVEIISAIEPLPSFEKENLLSEESPVEMDLLPAFEKDNLEDHYFTEIIELLEPFDKLDLNTQSFDGLAPLSGCIVCPTESEDDCCIPPQLVNGALVPAITVCSLQQSGIVAVTCMTIPSGGTVTTVPSGTTLFGNVLMNGSCGLSLNGQVMLPGQVNGTARLQTFGTLSLNGNTSRASGATIIATGSMNLSSRVTHKGISALNTTANMSANGSKTSNFVLKATASTSFNARVSYKAKATLTATANFSDTPPYVLNTARPRIFNTNFTALPAKVATTAGTSTWAAIITAAQAGSYSRSRMICAAGIFRAGLISGFTYTMTQAQYGNQALADYLTFLGITSTSTPADVAGYPALMYDWLWPLFHGTGNQTTILNAIQTILNTRDVSTTGLFQWIGYNNKAGDGMCNAVSIYGDVGTDFVRDFWTNNWTTQTKVVALTDLWNWNWNTLEQGDCGNNEGFGYYSTACATNWLTKAIWESCTTGTGSTLLQIGWFDRYPLWFLHYHEPGFPIPANSVGATFPWGMCTKNYEGTFSSSRDGYDMLYAATGMSSNATLAMWIITQLNGGWGFGFSGPETKLVYGLLMGDPRTVAQSPTTLSLPLKFTKQLGDIYLRSDWTSTSPVLFMSNNRWAMRSVQANGMMLYRRCPLLFYRGQAYGHTYEPGDFSNSVVFYSTTTIAVAPSTASTNNTVDVPTGTLTDNGDGTYTGNCIPNMIGLNGFNVNQVTTLTRKYDATNLSTGTVVITDTIVCNGALTPHIVWNMAKQPTITGNTTISFVGSDNTTTCTLTMNQSVPSIVPIGGFSTISTLTGTTNWTHNSTIVNGVGTSFSTQVASTQTLIGPDGFPYYVGTVNSNTQLTLRNIFVGTTQSGVTTTVAALRWADSFDGTTPSEINTDVPTYGPLDQMHYVGWWRVHCVLPPGGATIVTTITTT